jgi:PAS domain S-box-containing protein
MNTGKQGDADNLRRRAEELLARGPGKEQSADFADMSGLAQELAVHQAELELQNEELRETQLALQETRDRFASLYEHAPVGYVVLDAAGIVRQTNATWRAMLGRPDDDLTGRPFADTILPDDAPVFLARFRAFFRNPAEKQIVVRMRRAGGASFHARIEARSRAFWAEDAGTEDIDRQELMVIVSDVSDLHKARVEIEDRNRALQEANDRIDHINHVLLGIRNVNQLIVSEDDPRRLVERACDNLTETMGYHNAWIVLLGGEAARGLGLPDAGPVAVAASAGFDGGFKILRERIERGEFPDCMNRALEATDTIVTVDPVADCPDCPLHGEYGGRAGLTRRLDIDGVTYGVLTASVPAAYACDAEEQDLFDEVAGDLAFALHKIAAARRQEQSEQRLSLVIEGSALGTWEWNVQTNETVFNEQWAAMLGYTIDELTPYDYATWERLVHPDDLDRAREALGDCIAGRTPGFSCEFRMQHKDGRWVWILDRGRVMTRDATGKALGMFGTHTNITELKQAEELG